MTRPASRIILAFALFPLIAAILIWYVNDRGIDARVAGGAAPAFLLEAILYIASGLAPVQIFAGRMQPFRIAALLTALAPVSWILISIAVQGFVPWHGLAVLGMGAAAAFWYLLLPRRLAADLGFLLLMAAPVLFGVFDVLYPDPASRVPGQVLGLLMWYRTGLIAVLAIRKMEGIGFGFVPRASEWLIGLRNYLWFVAPGVGLALWVGFIRLRSVVWGGRTVLVVIVTFLGALWVLAVAEEFFFRGLLQQQLARLFRSDLAGLVVASLLFGCAHLGYRQFPNWPFALLATVAGLFYGRAYLQAGSIRAAMVTHALVFTTWRVFLA